MVKLRTLFGFHTQTHSICKMFIHSLSGIPEKIRNPGLKRSRSLTRLGWHSHLQSSNKFGRVSPSHHDYLNHVGDLVLLLPLCWGKAWRRGDVEVQWKWKMEKLAVDKSKWSNGIHRAFSRDLDPWISGEEHHIWGLWGQKLQDTDDIWE